MEDNTEKTTEEVIENGVETMSLSDTLNFASTGKKPVEQEKEVIEDAVELDDDKSKVTVEDKTDKEVEIKPLEEVKTKKIEVLEEKVVEKDPYEGIDEEDRPYFDFKRRNKGATRSDFEDSLIDYDKFDKKELLRKSLRDKYNFKSESDDDLDAYIEEELGIPMDSDESDMTITERVRLKKHTDEFIKAKKELHTKWAENKTDVVEKGQQEKMVTLTDGSQMSEDKYNKIVEQRKAYVKNNEETLNRVQETSFTFTVKDDNGEEREYSESYKFDKDDKNRVLSISNDAVKHFNETYQTEKGVDHESLNINKSWEDPITRGKMLKAFASTIFDKGKAEGVEEILSNRGNVNFNSGKGLQQQETKGVKIVPLSQILNN